MSAKIPTGCRANGEQFDLMMVIPRGSYYPANIVSRELGFGPTELLHACIRSHEDGNKQRNVRTGVLHYKPEHNQTDKWVVYPWEHNERHGKASQVRRKI